MFEGDALLAKMLTLQVFNATVAFTSLFFTAVVVERARAGEALERAAAELEERVRDRTAELSAANDRLTREEEALRGSEQRFRALLESAPDAAVIVDARGRIVLVNDQTERIFGYPRHELLGEPVEVLLPQRFHAAHVSNRTTYFAQPRTRPMGSVSSSPAGARTGASSRWRSPLPRSRRTRVASPWPLSGTSRAASGPRKISDRRPSPCGRTDKERRELLSRLVTAQEEERRRIASDIHDDTIQAVTAVGIRAATLARVMSDREEAGKLDALQNTVQAAITRLRRLVFELRPLALDRDGLVAALGVALDQAATDSGGSFNLVDRLAAEPPEQIRAIAYRIAQEAIANIREHSQARDVRVVVETREGGLFVLIEDDGQGFGQGRAESQTGHLGLTTMRERAELSGGWFRVRSSPGHGTTVEFWLPME